MSHNFEFKYNFSSDKKSEFSSNFLLSLWKVIKKSNIKYREKYRWLFFPKRLKRSHERINNVAILERDWEKGESKWIHLANSFRETIHEENRTAQNLPGIKTDNSLH